MSAKVATCPAGLGNRIKCMISTMIRCEDVVARPYVYWPVNDACGCEFEHLFESYYIKEVSKDKLKSLGEDAEINKSWKLVNEGKELDFKYDELSDVEINGVLLYIKSIKPANDILDTVWAFENRYKDSFEKREVIGVHIRKGDYKVSFDGRQYVSTEDKFINEMKSLLKLNSNYKFLLCTEDNETEEKFKKIFGAEVIIYFPKQFRGRNSCNSIKEAFVDMLLLSRCPIIIGTFLSTFTEMAWWWSDCTSQVIIPGAEDKKAVDKVLTQLPQKGEGIHRKIWRRLKIWVLE